MLGKSTKFRAFNLTISKVIVKRPPGWWKPPSPYRVKYDIPGQTLSFPLKNIFMGLPCYIFNFNALTT